MLTHTFFFVLAMSVGACSYAISGDLSANVDDPNALRREDSDGRPHEGGPGSEDAAPSLLGRRGAEICQEIWQRRHAATTPSPWAIAGVDSNQWTASAIIDGEQFDLRAVEFSEYEETVNRGHGRAEKVKCQVPIAWDGSTTHVRIEPIDCAKRNSIEQFNLKFQAIGGIVFETYMPGHPIERFDVAFAWHIRPGRIDEKDEASVRKAFGLEPNASLSLAFFPSLNATTMPGIAVSFSDSDRAEKSQMWGILNGSTRNIPTAKPFSFFSSEPIPRLTDDLVTASKDHPAVSLQALVAWDTLSRSKVPCDKMHRGTDQASWCGWVLPLRAEAWRQQTLERGKSGFVHILWSNGDESLFLTTVEVLPSGDLITGRTRPVDDVERLGLPGASDMLLLQWP